MAQGPAKSTRAAKKAESEQKEQEEASAPAPPTAGELHAALLQVNQMLALIDLPLAQGQPSKRPAGMHDGLVYGLRDLLIPLNSVMRGSGATAQNLAAAIGAPTNSTPAHELGAYVSSATGMTHILDQVVESLQAPLPGVPDARTALQVVERHLESHPLSTADERDLLLRLRQKRRRVMERKDVLSDAAAEQSAVPDEVRSPLYPPPSTLTFRAHTPWIESCARETVHATLAALVSAFNDTYADVCRAEAAALAPANPDMGQTLPAHRVRARLTHWSGASGDIEVELRDVALATIGVQVAGDQAHVVRLHLSAPSERPRGEARGVSASLLPSRFASYNALGDHLFLYALDRQKQAASYVEALGATLLHLAALRTYFDGLPVPETQVQTVPTRVAVATLDPESTLDRTKSAVWKWCRALNPAGLAPQGEWCAYSPSLL